MPLIYQVIFLRSGATFEFIEGRHDFASQQLCEFCFGQVFVIVVVQTVDDFIGDFVPFKQQPVVDLFRTGQTRDDNGKVSFCRQMQATLLKVENVEGFGTRAFGKQPDGNVLICQPVDAFGYRQIILAGIVAFQTYVTRFVYEFTHQRYFKQRSFRVKNQRFFSEKLIYDKRVEVGAVIAGDDDIAVGDGNFVRADNLDFYAEQGENKVASESQNISVRFVEFVYFFFLVDGQSDQEDKQKEQYDESRHVGYPQSCRRDDCPLYRKVERKSRQNSQSKCNDG